MPRQKEDRVTVGHPFNDPSFNRSAVYFYDIEYQRKFEQNLIRYGILTAENSTQTIIKTVNSAISGGSIGFANGGTGCYWLKDGATIYYDEGYVGVGKIPETWFNVQGVTRIEADTTDEDGDAFIEIVSQRNVDG